jgi:hemolysin activation/secretion protein
MCVLNCLSNLGRDFPHLCPSSFTRLFRNQTPNPGKTNAATLAFLGYFIVFFLIFLGQTLPFLGPFSLPRVEAQIIPPRLDPTGRSAEPPPLEQEPPPKPPSTPPRVLPVPPIPDLPKERLPLIRVMVRDIRVQGSTVFSPEELDQVVTPFENRVLTTEDLQEIRQALTLLYVNKGYVNSGAVLPDQEVNQGIILFQIIEGELTGIDIEGTQHFLPYYLESRLQLSAGPPLNINQLRERLQLLLQDSRLTRVNAELKPGLQPGDGVLHLRVEEASPYRAWLEFNNFQSPTVGAETGIATVNHQNLLGLGDIFQLSYAYSDGIDPRIVTFYDLPLTPFDTRLIVNYRYNDFSVTESDFKPLDIEIKSNIFSLTLRQPFYHTPTTEFALALTGERLQNKTFSSGEGTNLFSPGAKSNGESVVSALRFSQEWVQRQPSHVLALSSRLSVGIDVLGATNNDDPLPDTQFFSWLGQAQWAQRFDPLGIQLISRILLQVSTDRLFPLEQVSVGGRFSVRGYRENTLVRDNAFLFSVEPRIPVFPEFFGSNLFMQFAPFIDVGRAWNSEVKTPDPDTLASIGLGLRASIFQRAQLNFYWGVPLNNVSYFGDYNIQDDGIHIQFVVTVLD